MAPDSSSGSGFILDQLLNNPGDHHAWQRFVEHYGRRIYQWCLGGGMEDRLTAGVVAALFAASGSPTIAQSRKKPLRNGLRP